MATDTVAFVDDQIDYGSIETEDADGGEGLTEGIEIEFDDEQTDKGPHATNVQRP